jgi:DNA-binding Lrp family transcriptional regulator
VVDLTEVPEVDSQLERSDRELIVAMRQSGARPSVSELSRSLVLARGTVQARIERLESRGVVIGYGPEIDSSAAGLGVRAFTTLSIAQGEHEAAITGLTRIPEVVEVNTVTGDGDLVLFIVATSIDHLHDVIQRVAAVPEVSHTSTQLVLATPLKRSVADLLGVLDGHWWDD